MTVEDETARQFAETLRAAAARLEIDPATVTSPSPHAITARAMDGRLVRLDVSTYTACELSR